jgi:hypothetical protein
MRTPILNWSATQTVMMNADELWELIHVARRELEQAIAAQKAAPADATLAEGGDLRDRVSGATLDLMKLEHKWRRHVGGDNSKHGDL